MRLQNMKIRTRLLIGFGVILLFVIILGTIAFIQTGRIWQNVNELYNHPFTVITTVKDIQNNVNAIDHTIKDMLRSEDQSEIERAVHEIAVNEVESFKLFDHLRERYLGKKETLDEAYIAFRDWKFIRDEVIRLKKEGSLSLAQQAEKRSAEQFELIRSNMSVIREFALKKAASFYLNAEKEKNNLNIQLVTAFVSIIVLLLFIFFIIMKGITSPLKELVQVADKYRDGQYTARSRLISSNEIGLLSAAFNRMADSVNSQMIIKNSIKAISDAIIGKEELSSFGKALLSVILTETDSNIGAIYLLNDKERVFEHYESIGLSKDKIKSFSADTNEGEFGAALYEKKTIRISGIPDDTIFDFSTVAGVFRPREIITIPIMHQNKVVAIISLAAIKEYSQEILEIISISEKNLTAGINSILAFERIREYSAQLNIQNEQLEEQSKELRTQTEELQAQTNELQEQNVELDQQKRQITAANRLKSEFLSNMSHELRTPLNSVIALSGILNKRLFKKVPDEEYSFLEIIERNGRNLLALINDILDLSRIEAGKAELQYTKFSINDIVVPILSTLQQQINSKNIDVRNNVGAETPMITSDSAKVHHILQNLIGNAVKFTEKGRVEISAKQINSELYIYVKDTGIGIPANELLYIFEEFRQVDGSASRRHEGTGLGLSIADKYSKLLSGRIEVVSTLGEGSLFTFILPLEPHEKPAMVSISDRYSGSQANFSFLSVSFAEAGAKTILIIEDSEPAIIQVSEILKDQGYRVDVARSGEEALSAVKLKIPDGIILDLMMPGMDGFEVLEAIRGTKATATIPVLILTAKYLSGSELKRLTENNIHQLIQKGDISKNELISEVNKMLNRQNILIIDNNSDDIKTVKALFGKKYGIAEALEGYDGIAKAKVMKPEIILLEISLSGIDGFKVLDEIRKDESLKHTPVIALTARAMKGDREQILGYGFNGYISKPVDSNLFEKELEKWIKAG